MAETELLPSAIMAGSRQRLRKSSIDALAGAPAFAQHHADHALCGHRRRFSFRRSGSMVRCGILGTTHGLYVRAYDSDHN
jgi:hypothetical protein